MPNHKYKALLYFIAAVIAITLAIQVYWNYKNYQSSRQQLINEVQISLDNAVDTYYTILAKNNTVRFLMKKTAENEVSYQLDSLMKRIDLSSKGFKGLDSIGPGSIASISILKGLDSLVLNHTNTTPKLISSDSTKKNLITTKTFLKQHKHYNSLKSSLLKPPDFQKFFSSDLKPQDSINPWSVFTSKIIVSVNIDTLETKKMDSLVTQELLRKDLSVDYGLLFTAADSTIQKTRPEIIKSSNLKTSSNSKLLPDKSSLKLYFTNVSSIILKRNLLGILLSTLLIGCVIACLLFLLRIINKQKQLAELKNDLISNITHEFKTPISTIGVALEGIANFNIANDPQKTTKYVHTSTVQLGKLNTMVEKLLETATLDGDDLQLNKEEVSVLDLLKTLIKKHQSLAPKKEFIFESLPESILITADIFHLENALNNILDNAVKYGGEIIKVIAEIKNDQLMITIEDNGKELTSTQAKQIFDKFYRVPKGNTHNVKGFGIGLYYTKKIIEKHGGTITVATNGKTNFIISLPYV
tara:strand:+ start:1385 stop:2965 length:1581 start_codon:yes stop_codon:yes gene_type:complete